MDDEAKEALEKKRRIEAERMKAIEALNKTEQNKANLAYLDAPVKVKGFSWEPRALLMSAERMANASIVLAVLGIVFGVFSDVFSLVAQVNNLGLAGGAMSAIIGTIYTLGIMGAVLTGVITLVCVLVTARRTTYKVKPIAIAAGVSLGMVVIYGVIRYVIVQWG